MALDVQQNWNVCMAESFHRSRNLSKTTSNEAPASRLPPDSLPQRHGPRTSLCPGEPVYLPDEIILHILDYARQTPQAQHTLRVCTLLNRQWYDAAVPLLYESPYLYGWNFDPFYHAICPSINLHVRKSPLSELVKVLNLSGLVHQGSKSVTARLLGRTKNNLEEFVAPQASFAINCFPALSKCRKLRKLDLSLVSEVPGLQILFRTVTGLDKLRELRLPRSSGFGTKAEPSEIVWPSMLERLFLSGGIDNNFLYGVVQLPRTLQEMTIEHCPQAKRQPMRYFLENLSSKDVSLTYLKISHMPRMNDSALDYILAFFPGLTTLSVSVDYITPDLFDKDYNNLVPGQVKLRMLELTNSGNPGIEDKITPTDIMIAMEEGNLSHLRQVRVAKSLGWHHQLKMAETNTLDDQLCSAEDAADAFKRPEDSPTIMEAGIRIFDG